MKKFLFGPLALMTISVQAQDMRLREKNWTMSDIAKMGLTKEALFEKMNIDPLRRGGSICSNRAHFWAYDFKRLHNLNTGKMFVFYSKDNSRDGGKRWWYHVTPYVIENGQEWAMDKGFPAVVDQPVTFKEWFKAFARTTECKEITIDDKELIDHMFAEYPFPNYYQGKYEKCYYIKTPGTYWTPGTVAEGLLGHNEEGHAGNMMSRERFVMDEVKQACVEVVRSRWAPIGGLDTCKKYFRTNF